MRRACSRGVVLFVNWSIAFNGLKWRECFEENERENTFVRRKNSQKIKKINFRRDDLMRALTNHGGSAPDQNPSLFLSFSVWTHVRMFIVQLRAAAE